jgi:hypothetical protein
MQTLQKCLGAMSDGSKGGRSKVSYPRHFCWPLRVGGHAQLKEKSAERKGDSYFPHEFSRAFLLTHVFRLTAT